jgi:hypothetical protein
MCKELVRYKGYSRKFFMRIMGGMVKVKKENMAKVSKLKCGQSHTDKPVSREIIGTSKYFGIPVICGGRKSAREMYLETR